MKHKRHVAVAATLWSCLTMIAASPLHAADPIRAARLAAAFGNIDSLDPCGIVSGAPKPITFTARVNFHGEGFGGAARAHTFTLRLVVIDDEGTVICTHSQEWIAPDGEHGCIKCPVSCKSNGNLDSGVYFVTATLADQPQGGSKTKIDAKSCALILTP